MLFRSREKNIPHENGNKVEEHSLEELFSIGNYSKAFELYNKNVKCSLSVCYRYTLRTLCNNNQYNIAIVLTNQIREKGIIILPSSLALILSMFKINENFVANFDNEKVNFLDFQEEIFEIILLATKFEKMNFLNSKDKSQQIENREEFEIIQEMREECCSDSD